MLQKCQVLEHYSIFIQRVKEYNNSMKDLDKAINKAVDECIQDGILKDILEMQKKEGFDLVLTEFDEEKYEAMIREEAHIETLCSLVSKNIITMEQALEESGLTEKEFLEKIKEYGLDK